MLRTRDFLLFLLAVAFLVTGIVSTIDFEAKEQWYSFNFIDGDDKYEAWLPEEKELNREELLEAMKEKVAKININNNLASVITAPEGDNDNSVDVVEEENSNVVSRCAGYGATDPLWSPSGLKFDVVEGARILYREIIDVNDSASTTVPVREIVLQLPLKSVPFGKSQCLSQSVIGVALDGSLIHNEDYTAYKVFGAETLVGYALDGFPIYGLNETGIKTDGCGGVIENSQYHYYLSSEREGMIGCFSGTPVSL